MQKKRCVLVICDSLRNDLLGESTPTLMGLAQKGTRFTHAQAVFPSTTRVSAASIATGCYPSRHGLLGNTMILTESDGLRVRSVGKPEFREHLYAATGRYLRAPTLAQRLHTHFTSAIYSNVSPGAAYFFDPERYGYVYHRAGSYAPGGRELKGTEGMDIESGASGDRVLTQRFCEHLLSDESLALAVLWLSEPDASGHAQVLGGKEHHVAIRHADSCVATVQDVVETLREQGEDVLFMVGSDHGMETISHEINIAHELVKAGLKDSETSRDIVVAPNGTAAVLGYDEHYMHREPLLQWLEQQPWVGEFAAGEALTAWGMPDEVASRVVISLAGNDEANSMGVAGTAWYASDPDHLQSCIGQGQHGGRSKHERHPFLFVTGGEFMPAMQVSEPVSLIDYAPTFLRHLGMPSHDMQGKPLHQFLSVGTGTTSIA